MSSFFRNILKYIIRIWLNIDEILAIIERWFLFFGLLILLFIVGLQILGRLFYFSQRWTQELAQYILIWNIFIGVSLGIRANEHASFDFLKFKAVSIKPILEMIIRLSVGFFCLMIIIYGIKLIQIQMMIGRNTVSLPTNIPIYYFYHVFPICFSFCLFHLISSSLKRYFTKYGILVKSNNNFFKNIKARVNNL